MKRLLSILSVTVAMVMVIAPLTEAGERPATARAFIEAPAAVFPLIDSLTRLDMVDYALAGSDTGSQNAAGGLSRISAINNDSLTIEMGQAVTHTLYLLPAEGRDTVYAVVRTVAMPALDSSVQLFDSKWRPLKNSAMALPLLDGWLKTGDKTTRQRAAEGIPFVPARVSINPSSGTMTIYNTLDQLLPKETFTEFAPMIYPTLTYRWDGTKFKLVK